MVIQRRPSGEFTIFLLALPALASPLILLPAPEFILGRRMLVSAVAMLCTHPLLWASAATLFSAVWLVRSRASRVRMAIGASIALLAWGPALYTASVLSALDRF